MGKGGDTERGQEEPHVFVVHGCQDSFADRGGIGMEPRGGKSQPLVLRAQRAGRGLRAGHQEATYFRWSSIMQLASSVAVGLAIFLLAILLPVFLVAWKRKENRWKT
jgi:hypothetical protein